MATSKEPAKDQIWNGPDTLQHQGGIATRTKVDYSELEVVHDPQREMQDGQHLEVDRNRMQAIRNENSKRPYEFAEEAYYAPPQYVAEKDQISEQEKKETGTIFGMRRKTFWIALVVALLIVISAAIGGGVGGALANKTSNSGSSPPQDANKPLRNDTTPAVKTRSLGAVQWVDNQGLTQYRVYHQDDDGQIIESYWSSDSNEWSVSNNVTNTNLDVKANTPLAVTGGYPHANTSWPGGFAKSVFYLTSSGKAIERQSPYKESVGVWGNDNFSGLFSASNASSIAAYWHQNLTAHSQVFSALFQEQDTNNLIITKFADSPWENQTFALDMEAGSPIAIAPAGGEEFNFKMYVGGSNRKLVKYQYDFGSSDVSLPEPTDFDLLPQTPLCVSAQDNTGYFKKDALPSCAGLNPLTHLLLFATPDRSGLKLVSWNCSDDFVDQSDAIKSLLKPNATYVGVASHEDGRVYVMSEDDAGLTIEEWAVPAGGRGGNWSVVGNIPLNVTT